MTTKPVQILVICRHPEILQTILRLIRNKPEWEPAGCAPGGAALDLIGNQKFDVVLLGAGIEPHEDAQLRKSLSEQQPGVRIVQHYGGGSGLLFAEIYQALNGN